MVSTCILIGVYINIVEIDPLKLNNYHIQEHQSKIPLMQTVLKIKQNCCFLFESHFSRSIFYFRFIFYFLFYFIQRKLEPQSPTPVLSIGPKLNYLQVLEISFQSGDLTYQFHSGHSFPSASSIFVHVHLCTLGHASLWRKILL